MCKKTGSFALFLLFGSVYLWLSFRHVWFRDEAQILLMARASETPWQLWGYLRYEGTTGLFHSLVWLLGRVTELTVPSCTLLYAPWLVAYVALVCFGLPLPLAGRVSLLLHPAGLYYATNVRQYLPSAVLLLAFFTVRTRSPLRFGTQTLLLALAMQSSLHAMLCAGALYVFLIFDPTTRVMALRPAPLALMIVSTMLAIAQLSPPSDLIPGLRECASNGLSIDQAAFGVLAGAFSANPLLLAGALMAIIFILWQTALECRHRLLGATGALTLLILAFALIAYFKYSEDRHHWLLGFTTIGLLLILHSHLKTPTKPIIFALFWGFMVLGSLASFPSVWAQYTGREKSASKRAAEYLDAEYPGRTVVSHLENFENPIRAYRHQAGKVYALGRGAFVPHTVWNDPSVDYRRNPDARSVRLSVLAALLEQLPESILSEQPILVLSGDEIVSDLPGVQSAADLSLSRARLEPRKIFRGADFERYQLYEIIPAVPPAARSP